MKTRPIASYKATQAFVSAKAAVVLAIIACSTALLAYEWHEAHPTAQGTVGAALHHHHKHQPKTAAVN